MPSSSALSDEKNSRRLLTSFRCYKALDCSQALPLGENSAGGGAPCQRKSKTLHKSYKKPRLLYTLPDYFSIMSGGDYLAPTYDVRHIMASTIML
jgi:hypothetical protein